MSDFNSTNSPDTKNQDTKSQNIESKDVERQTNSLDDLYNSALPLSPVLTPVQSGAFNGLLTQLSQRIFGLGKVDYLPVVSQPTLNAQVKDHSSAKTNWYNLLEHLYTVVLPEVYVFFHDNSTTNTQHRYLHELCKQLFTYLDFYYWQAKADHKNAISQADNYLTGKGKYANIACELLPLAELSDINEVNYLGILKQLFDTIIVEKQRMDFLLHHTKAVDQQLQYWLHQRLNTFSKPSQKQLLEHPSLLNIEQAHPLANYLQRDYEGKDNTGKKFDEANYLTEIEKRKPAFSTGSDFFTGVFLLSIGCVLITFAHQWFVMWLFAIVLGSTSLALLYRDFNLSGVNIDNTSNKQPLTVTGQPKIQHRLTKHRVTKLSHVLLLSGVLMIFGLVMPSLFFLFGYLVVFAVLLQCLVHPNTKLIGYLQEVAWQNFRGFRGFRGSQGFQEQAVKQKSFNAIDAANNEEERDEKFNIFPVMIQRHARYLYLLLTQDNQRRLNELIAAINQSHAYLDYLETEYPYLATSVHELLLDVTMNSILRANELAKTFVHNNQVEAEAKKIFASTHETQLSQLFANHLEELHALNASILDKQMAGFAYVASDAARQFRDTLIELKILLRWFVAQQPDELAATQHQVILNNLQEHTLTQMSDFYHHANTTDKQRTQLQNQAQQLLQHFQSQSPKTLSEATEGLLQLPKQRDDATNRYAKKHGAKRQGAKDENGDRDEEGIELNRIQDSISNEHTSLQQSSVQQFIDFNAQYVKQLKQHW